MWSTYTWIVFNKHTVTVIRYKAVDSTGDVVNRNGKGKMLYTVAHTRIEFTTLVIPAPCYNQQLTSYCVGQRETPESESSRGAQAWVGKPRERMRETFAPSEYTPHTQA